MGTSFSALRFLPLNKEREMAHEDDDHGKVWNLVDKIGFCVLTTQSGNELRAWPMSAHNEEVENAIYFPNGCRQSQGR